MTEPHDRGPTPEPEEATTEVEVAERQIQNLRRWVNVDPADSSEPAPTPQPAKRSSGRGLPWFKGKPAATPEPSSQPSPQEAGSDSLDAATDELLQTAQRRPRHRSSSQANQSSGQKVLKKKRMAKKDEYREWLKQDFNSLFDRLNLQDRQRHYLSARWLDQVLWMEGKANQARDFYYKLRLTTIVGGVIIPALVSINFTSGDTMSQTLKTIISASTFILSQLVAISAATEQFFNYGERWRHYRRSVESLKTQGWQYFELTGPYQSFSDHTQAFNTFAGEVEAVLQKDVEVYASQVTQTKKEDEQTKTSSAVTQQTSKT